MPHRKGSAKEENPMKSKLLAAIVILLSGLAALAQPPNPNLPSYTVTDLGTINGGTFSIPYSMDAYGLVSGAAALPNNSQQAVLWMGRVKLDIGKPGLGGPDSVAFATNTGLQAVGEAENSTKDPNGEDFCGFGTHLECLPFLWQHGVMSALPTLGGTNGVVNQINKEGLAAGWAENTVRDPNCPAPQVLEFKPVTWTNGRIQQLPTVNGDAVGVALAANDSGVVVGSTGDCAAFNQNLLFSLTAVHAVLWQSGKAIDLGNLGGGSGQAGGNIAWSINNARQVVGASDLPGDTNFHGFRWTSTTGMQDLGTLEGDVNSTASWISDKGEVVGASFDANFNARAFLWKNGVMTDINTLVPANSPIYMLSACSINSSGEITGLGMTSGGQFHAYLATPITAGPHGESVEQ
jgi:probable HAF family extracellular repeat protein